MEHLCLNNLWAIKRENATFFLNARRNQKRCGTMFWGTSSMLCNIQNPNRQWDMATIKSIFIGCVISHNIIIEDESNCNLEYLFNVGSNVSHLKQGLSIEIYCQVTTQIENVATITTSKMTLSNICGLEKATTQTKVKNLVCSKKLVNTHFY